jgi:hypothetical protein
MGQEPPQMSATYQHKLHLHPILRVGDWFILKSYIVIRIYDCEIDPYELPMYIPPHLFALKFCRQRLVVDQLHFVSKSKNVSFCLPAEPSSFLIKI